MTCVPCKALETPGLNADRYDFELSICLRMFIRTLYRVSQSSGNWQFVRLDERQLCLERAVTFGDSFHACFYIVC